MEVRLIPEEVFRRILKGWTGVYDPAPLYTLAGEPLDWKEVRPVILVGPGVVELRFLREGEPEEVRSGVYRAIYIPLLAQEELLSEYMDEALPLLIEAARGAGERWTPEAEEALRAAGEILDFEFDEVAPVVYAAEAVWGRGRGPHTCEAFARGWGEYNLDLLLRGEVEVVADWVLDCQKAAGYVVPGGLNEVKKELEKFLRELKGGESEG